MHVFLRHDDAGVTGDPLNAKRVGVSLSESCYVAFGLLIGAVIAVMRLRARRMSFGETHFHYDGWLGPLDVLYSDISKVENSSKLGYPYDRFHGPNEYRITTPSERNG